LLDDLVVGSRVLASNGHADYIWGHASVRDPDGRGGWMKSSGLGLEEVGHDDLLLVGPDGEVLEGEGRRHIEWPIHLEVLAARQDIGSVVHTHPPHSIALGSAGAELQAVSHAGTLFVPPNLPRFTRTGELIVDRAMGREVAEALGDARALLLVNHGIVAVGATVPEAICVAILLEKAAEQQLLVEGFGGARHVSDDAEALAKRATVWSASQMSALWDYLIRNVASETVV
jgi:L-fuculose-phosphate aldolase